MASAKPSPIMLDYAPPQPVSNWRAWCRAMVVVLIAGSIGALLLPLFVPVRYAAVAIVSDNGPYIFDRMEATPTWRVAAETELGSTSLLTIALNDPKLAGKQLTPAAVQSQLAVKFIAGTQEISVRHTSSDPLLSANIVNAVTAAYIAQNPARANYTILPAVRGSPVKNSVGVIGFVLGMIIGAILLRQFRPRWFSKSIAE